MTPSLELPRTFTAWIAMSIAAALAALVVALFLQLPLWGIIFVPLAFGFIVFCVLTMRLGGARR